MAKNVYEDPLYNFTFDEMLASLSGIGIETGRLELKRELNAGLRPQVAYIACAMANADGGLIAIGIDEPKGNAPLSVFGAVDTSDESRAALIAAMNARVYPPPPIELHPYEKSGSSFLIVRVGRSVVAPHEYIPADKPNLPIKRGNITDRLTLSEIDALRARSRNSRSESPLGQRYDWVTLQQVGTGPDFMIGIVITPTAYAPRRRVMDSDDDALCELVATNTSGRNGDVHRNLIQEVLPDGCWLHTPLPEQPVQPMPPPQPEEQIEIASDGKVIVKFLESDSWKRDFRKKYLDVLVVGYVASQRIYRGFGIAPRARAHIVMRLSAYAKAVEFAQGFDDVFDIDLATQTFADAFLATTMRMYRVAKLPTRREEIRTMLQSYVDNAIPIADELQAKWLA
jgi:Putative DNA-binding domain